MKRSMKLRTRVQGPSQPGPAGPGRSALHPHNSPRQRGPGEDVGSLPAGRLAYFATTPSIRRHLEPLTGPYLHDSTVSAWWILFERWARNRNIELACVRDDGSSVRGQFGSFNISADDSPDRDLILQYSKPDRPSPTSSHSEAGSLPTAEAQAAQAVVTSSEAPTKDPAQSSPRHRASGPSSRRQERP
jgi:hypothetical protein